MPNTYDSSKPSASGKPAMSTLAKLECFLGRNETMAIPHLLLIDTIEDIRRYCEALEKLAKLHNEPMYGNSEGNVIAYNALFPK